MLVIGKDYNEAVLWTCSVWIEMNSGSYLHLTLQTKSINHVDIDQLIAFR